MPKESSAEAKKNLKAQKLLEKQENERKQKEQEFLMRQNLEIQENKLRRTILKETVESLDRMQEEYLKTQEEIKERDDWENYTSCDNRPDPKNFHELRMYLDKLRLDVVHATKQVTTWLLDVDERCKLSQDLDKPDKTATYIRHGKPPVGDKFCQKIDEILIILDLIERNLHLLSDKNSMNFIEVMKTRDEYRDEIYNLFGRFTREVLVYFEQEMSPQKNPIKFHHIYQSPNFKFNLWSVREFPPKWTSQEIKLRLDGLEIEIISPISITNLDENAFRGIWMKWDHLSDTVKTPNFKLPENMNLKSAMEKEWETRQNMKRNEIDRMKGERETWEQLELERIALEEEKMKNQKKGGKEEVKTTKKKGKKVTIPPIVTDETVVEVNEMYLEHEDREFNEQRSNMDPALLNLDEHEMNLQCFRCVGGIYSFDWLKRPTPFTKISTILCQRIDDHHHKVKNENNMELMTFHLKLPGSVIWAVSPIVCRWEPIELPKDPLENMEKSGQLFSAPEIKPDFTKIKIFNDFYLTDLPPTIKLSDVIKRFIAPRVSLDFKLECEIEQEMEIVRKKMRMEKELELELAEIEKKRFQEFLDRMAVEREINDVRRVDLIAEKNIQFEEKRSAMTRKMENAGESKRMVDKYLSKQIEEDEQVILAEDDLERLQFEEYVAVKKLEEFPPIIEDPNKKNDSKIVEVGTIAQDLFPLKVAQFPLKIITNSDQPDLEFDVKGIKQMHCPAEAIQRPEIGSSVLFSEFMKYLDCSRLKKDNSKFRPEKITRIKAQHSNEISDSKEITSDLTLVNQVNSVRGKWKLDGISAIEFNQTTNELTFQSTYLGIFGIALPKYFNLPLKGWSLCPNLKCVECTFMLRGQFIDINIELTEDGFYLEHVTYKKPIFNRNSKPLTLEQLTEMMIAMGLDFFPDCDASHYVEGCNEKHSSMEFHTYLCISKFALTHEFKYSEFNRKTPRRLSLIHVREYIEKPGDFSEVMITPLKCNFVVTKMVEKAVKKAKKSKDKEKESILVMEHFLTPEEQDFYPDLRIILKQNMSEITKKKLRKINCPLFEYNLYKILKMVRPLSFS